MANQAGLAATILDYANDLQVAWSIEMKQVSPTSGQTVLSANGELYFLNAIPGLQYLAPLAFLVTTTDPQYTSRTWGTTKADAYRNRFVGTWVQNSLTAFGNLFTVNAQTAMGLPIIAICLAIIILKAIKFKNVYTGLMDTALILQCGVLLGFVSMAVNSVISLLCGVFIGFIIFKPND